MYPAVTGKTVVAVNAFVPDTEQVIDTFHSRELNLVSNVANVVEGALPVGNTPFTWNAQPYSAEKMFNNANYIKSLLSVNDETPATIDKTDENTFRNALKVAVDQFTTA